MGTVGGAELAAGQLEAILDLGVEILPDTALALSVDGGVKKVTTHMGTQKAKNVIIASGARTRRNNHILRLLSTHVSCHFLHTTIYRKR